MEYVSDTASALKEATAGHPGWIHGGNTAIYKGNPKASITYLSDQRRWRLVIEVPMARMNGREFISGDVRALVAFAMNQQTATTPCAECAECKRCELPNYGAWRQGECTCATDSSCVTYRSILEAVSQDRMMDA